MKKNLLKRYIHGCFLLTFFAFACTKSDKSGNAQVNDVKTDSVTIANSPLSGEVPFPQHYFMHCSSGPDYGDSILYTLNKGANDYIAGPVNNPGPGKYYSWPSGLVIDSTTGAINLTQSEQGARYMVGFVKNGTTDTCMQQLVLAGISYVDSIYNLSNNDTLARPYYNASINTPAVCNASGADDYPGNSNGKGNGDSQCQFDGPGNNGKAHQANDAGIKIRSVSGIIDLKYTLASGAFGPNPTDGQVVKATLYYQLNNQGKKAQQHMQLRLMYYHSLSAVPSSLVQYVQEKRNNILANAMIQVYGHQRPPLIVIIR